MCFEYLPLPSHIICKYFLPFDVLSFHVVYCFFCCAKTVKFDVVPLVYFCCYFFCLKKLIQENIAMVYVRVFCLCSLLGGSWNSVFPLGL